MSDQLEIINATGCTVRQADAFLAWHRSRLDQMNPAGWQYCKGGRWIYALCPTERDAQEASYGGFEDRPLNVVRPLFSRAGSTTSESDR